MSRTNIFVSYSHDDRAWLERLVTHLGVLERQNRVALWSDERIRIGAAWETEIERALSAAKVAVLLISPGFLASKYIWDGEMEPILRHEKAGMEVLPLIVRPCAWLLEPELARLQARPRYGRPLSLCGEGQIDAELAAFVYEVAAKIEVLSGSAAASEMTRNQQYVSALEAEPQRQRETMFLARNWHGFYKKEREIRLVLRDVTPDGAFEGRMEYPTEGTITIVQGKILADPSETDRVWARFGTEPETVRLQFRETRYEREGSKPISFRGEYRAIVTGDKMHGGWFQGARLIGNFELESLKK